MNVDSGLIIDKQNKKMEAVFILTQDDLIHMRKPKGIRLFKHGILPLTVVGHGPHIGKLSEAYIEKVRQHVGGGIIVASPLPTEFIAGQWHESGIRGTEGDLTITLVIGETAYNAKGVCVN